MGTRLPEKQTSEESGDTSGQKLNVGGLRKSDDVQKVTSSKELPLVAPWSNDLNRRFVSHQLWTGWIFVSCIILQVTGVVLSIEILNESLIFNFNSSIV